MEPKDMCEMSSCEYCEPYYEASVDKRDRFGTGFVVAVDATAQCMIVEFYDRGEMVEHGIVEISHCPFCGRNLRENLAGLIDRAEVDDD